MAKIEIRLPEMGESVAEATITSWVKSVGDRVEADEVIVEVATDKVDSEVVSEFSGILVKQLFSVDQVAKVGEVLAVVETDQSVPETFVADTPDTEVAVSNTESLPEQNSGEAVDNEPVSVAIESAVNEVVSALQPSGQPKGFISPLVRSIAAEEGISEQELGQIIGSGLDGRITKHDMMAYLERRSKTTVAADTVAELIAKPTPVPPLQKPELSSSIKADADDQIIELSRMTRLTADHMSHSLQTAAHVQSFIEVDMTRVVEWRAKVKTEFERLHGEKLTFTPLFFEVVAKALKAYPMMNIQFDGKNIIKKSAVNIGMATALADGNLIVPVIGDADTLNLVGLAKRVNDLAARARSGALKPDEVMKGTYTITNIGSFGSVMGTPIIPQPQVGILAIGAIRKIPAVVETDQGEFIAIRHKMFLSHSYDHRVVNGALGGLFIKYIADLLEQWPADRKV